MRQSETGNVEFRTFVTLAFLAALIFLAIKTIPPYVDNYQLQDQIRQISIQASARIRQVTADEVRDEVVAFARAHDLPVTPDDVTVGIADSVSIKVDYTVPVDLKVYTLNLHFTPAAENRSL
jgi:hypothetical protein